MIDKIIAELDAEEGWRAAVYDDATGQPITKGTLVQGYPTIGFGFCVDAFRGEPMPKEVGDLWQRMLVAQRIAALTVRWPPFVEQPDDVKRALIGMSYQMGVEGVMGFGDMIAALERGDRDAAATEALDSHWAHDQTHARAQRMATLIRGTPA